MEQFRDFILVVWREACKHIEIAESTAGITKMLVQRVPINRLIVRRIDKERLQLETLAVGIDPGGEKAAGIHTELTAVEVKRLIEWCGKGKVALRKAGDTSKEVPFMVIPTPLQGDVLIGPLVSGHGTFGLLILGAMPNHHFTSEDEAMCQALLEPFAVALDNDHRLRELNALREAAEADKNFLLTRLGRDEVSDTIIGAEGGLRTVIERVGLVARSDVPVIILGETGSGKEVIARAIHNYSPRANGPFIRVNCGAIAPGLIDSELFGHEKGSFTGAVSARRGWFERANEGTLFLDEIGELPQTAQVRLLRVLQDGSFERVGGERAIKVDVRIVSATHRDLTSMVQDGNFREDLWYRIAVFPIVLPPLRERREDIPALAEHFTTRASVRFGLKLQMLSSDDISLLVSYNWPGNVRELSSVIDRSVILGDGGRIEVAKALGAATDITMPSNKAYSSQRDLEPSVSPAILPLDSAMKRHIETALAATHGRIEGPNGAAALLKINPHTLRARMKKLSIHWTHFRQEGIKQSR